MRHVRILLTVNLLLLTTLLAAAADRPSTRPVDYNAWINGLLNRMDELKNPGTTYAEFTKTFDLDGGLNTVPASRFALRECPAIKVDVSFNDVERGRHPAPDTKIASISKPYLERPYLD